MAARAHSVAGIALASNNDGMSTYACYAPYTGGAPLRAADRWSTMNTYASTCREHGQIAANRQLASLSALLVTSRSRGPVMYAILSRGG